MLFQNDRFKIKVEFKIRKDDDRSVYDDLDKTIYLDIKGIKEYYKDEPTVEYSHRVIGNTTEVPLMMCR